MKNQPTSTMSGAPEPHPSTDKTYYQSRMDVRPTTTSQVGFRDTMEGPDRKLDYNALVMSMSDINSRAPNAMERGVAIDQDGMGKNANHLVHEKKFG